MKKGEYSREQQDETFLMARRNKVKIKFRNLNFFLSTVEKFTLLHCPQ